MEATKDKWGELAAPLRRFVRRRVTDPHAADDITQDVMLKVQANLDSLPPDERLAAWMFRTARNAIIDHYRARAVRDHGDVADAEAVAVEDEPAEQAQVITEVAGCLRQMVDRLDEPYRQALKLADLEGLSQQQVADRVGISLSGVKSRVQRARQQLRSVLLACCRFERDGRGSVIDYSRHKRSGQQCGNGCDSDNGSNCD